MKNALAFLTVSILAATCAEPSFAAQRKFGTVSFDRIRIDGNFNADITSTTGANVTADGDTLALERLEVVVNDRVLTIRQKRMSSDRGASDRNVRPIQLTIRAVGLQNVTLNGNGRVIVNGMNQQAASLTVNGNGEIQASAVNVSTASASIDGAGRITVAGKAQSFTASLRGAGSMDTRQFAVRDLDVSTSGSGKGSFAASRRASVNAEGLGLIEVTGTAACTVKNTGNGEVFCGR